MIEAQDVSSKPNQRPRRLWSRVMILIRRIHLYAGLFLLPWVFLYGITGAMYNHQNLFPEISTQPVPVGTLDDSAMADFPTPEEFAQLVVESLEASSDDVTISLSKDHRAEFTNEMMFEVFESGDRKVVHIDPVSKAAKVVSHPENKKKPQPLLNDLPNIQLAPDPHDTAQNSVATVLKEAGIKADGTPKPIGWTKLNFLADVNGEPARVTYVLKDGHVDVTRFNGDHELSLRHFFLRLHTAHGQPPHWNARMFWSLFIDVMAIAMVCWGVSGLLMWWQIKRTRLIGSAVIALSVLTATVMYLSMHGFYAVTKL